MRRYIIATKIIDGQNEGMLVDETVAARYTLRQLKDLLESSNIEQDLRSAKKYKQFVINLLNKLGGDSIWLEGFYYDCHSFNFYTNKDGEIVYGVTERGDKY